MNKREITGLACKILGIFFIIQGTNVLSNILTFLIPTPNPTGHEILLNIIFSSVYILFGVLLWFLSDKISAVMVKEKKHFDIKSSSIGIDDIHRVSFSVLGLYFIGNSLPKLVSNLTYSMSNGPNSITRVILGSVGVITEFIIGLWIFFGSQGLINFLNNIRTTGLKRENDTEEEE
ncbi:hypothetical protein [Desulfitobacterium sp.]|uniref:hypothetical protein n=1 Tax=Desulfitobacterium sp. TaxID=49981 RepID=UPI002CB3E77D|nr:hypothetical protein [Desulfitobacterium sp.]HVJ50664.1 hypothetical protein [Desulfitobacterium sp.]